MKYSLKPSLLRQLLASLAFSFTLIVFFLDESAGQSALPSTMHNRDGEFTSVILITSDPDWLQKWDTPSSTIPQFNVAPTLKAGDTAAVLILFSGLSEAGGRLKLMCDIEIRKLDGVTQKVPEAVCYDEPSIGQRKNVLLGYVRIEFKVQSDDPPGFLEFRIKLRDANSSARTFSEVGVRVEPESGRP